MSQWWCTYPIAMIATCTSATWAKWGMVYVVWELCKLLIIIISPPLWIRPTTLISQNAPATASLHRAFTKSYAAFVGTSRAVVLLSMQLLSQRRVSISHPWLWVFQIKVSLLIIVKVLFNLFRRLSMPRCWRASSTPVWSQWRCVSVVSIRRHRMSNIPIISQTVNWPDAWRPGKWASAAEGAGIVWLDSNWDWV
jgi:hypothetical protein